MADHLDSSTRLTSPHGDHVEARAAINRFTAGHYLTTLARFNVAVSSGNAIEVPLPPATFHCEVVPANRCAMRTPVTPAEACVQRRSRGRHATRHHPGDAPTGPDHRR